MKNFKYLFLFILLGFAIPSCVEDEAPEDAYGKGQNLASFRDGATTISGVADGSSYNFSFPMLVKGPALGKLSDPITATISVDPSSTAIEGVHYTLETTTITLSPENNYLNRLPITMLSEGIQAPLEESPVLVLNVTDASGETSIIPNGKPLTVTLNYLCFSNLAGTYNVTIENFLNGAFVGTYTYTDVISETGDGEYRGTKVGHWGDLGVGTPGFTFMDVCNVITIPEQNLVDYYSNIVLGIPNESYVDPETGTIYMNFTVCASGSCRENYTTYVKQ